MIKESMKDGNIMTNATNKDIIYLNHRTSILAKPNNENSSIPNSLSNILKNRTTILGTSEVCTKGSIIKNG